MSDGNKLDVIARAQQRQATILPFQQMGNELLDTMQGALICLDRHHIIVDVSQTIKSFFGFDQTDLIGLSIVLLIEDSERDAFLKFLNSTQPTNEMCRVRMMMNNTNDYRQVKIQRKRKLTQEHADVHSTTPRHTCSVGTVLLVTIEESLFIDITLHDTQKQEFYTKMNLIGEITFEDHRGALITGYLPSELIRKSIFHIVYHDDRLVKLHALWKCVTTGVSKLQWRMNARDGSLVFLQTEYKLILDTSNLEIIVARNEVLSPVQRAQFDELQTAWRHQCTADIKGNSSSFKSISPTESESSFTSHGSCRICVPSLNMCFTTNKLQPLNIVGNIFDGTKLSRPLTIQDYISILIDNDKYIDGELATMITNIKSLTARYRRLNETEKPQADASDNKTEPKGPPESSPVPPNTSIHRKQDSDLIVRGILSSAMQSNHSKPEDPPSTLTRLLNGNGNHTVLHNGTSNAPSPTGPFNSHTAEFPNNASKTNATSLSPEILHQQHIEFIKKYNSAKAKLESQLEFLRSQELADGGQLHDVSKRNAILSKLSQLETIKNKHLARRHDLKRQTTATVIPVHNSEQQDFLNSLFPIPASSSGPSGTTGGGFRSMDTNGTSTSVPSPLGSLFSSLNDQPSPSVYSSTYPQTRNGTQQFDSHPQMKTSSFDDFLTPPPSSSSAASSSVYLPVHSSPSLSVHSYMNVSFHGTTNDSITSTSFHTNHHHQHQHQHHSTYPY